MIRRIGWIVVAMVPFCCTKIADKQDKSYGNIEAKASGPAAFMVGYTKDIMKIVRDNIGDCNVAIKEAQAYADRNMDSLKEAKKAVQEIHARLSEEEKIAFREQMTKSMEEVVKITINTMTEFSQRCPEQAGKFNEMMGAIK